MHREDGPLLLHASVSVIFIAAAVGGSSAESKQTAAATTNVRDSQEIVIVGERRSAVKNVDPIATLDSNDIAATGATTVPELLRAIRPLTQSAGGGDPIFLLNGQRTSGYDEIGSLPPEAIDKVEVLPEPAALKYGYPPTRRLLNFITKRNFRQVEVKGDIGMTTRPGSTSPDANFTLPRLRKGGRLTLALESRHTSSILQSERHL